MRNNVRVNIGIQSLLQKYKKIFRTPENVHYYSENTYKIAERKFLQYALIGCKTPLQQNSAKRGNWVSA